MRYTVSCVLGIVIAAVLFYLMQALVNTGSALTHRGPISCFGPVEIVKVRPEPPPPPKPEPPEPPEPVESVLSVPEVEITAVEAPTNTLTGIDVSIPTGFQTGVPVLQRPDGGPTPSFTLVAGYPTRAARLGVEGWVEVELTVGRNGSVTAVRVIDEKPRGMFRDHARQAVFRWTFKPRYRDGEPVESSVRQVIKYRLRED